MKCTNSECHKTICCFHSLNFRLQYKKKLIVVLLRVLVREHFLHICIEFKSEYQQPVKELTVKKIVK